MINEYNEYNEYTTCGELDPLRCVDVAQAAIGALVTDCHVPARVESALLLISGMLVRGEYRHAYAATLLLIDNWNGTHEQYNQLCTLFEAVGLIENSGETPA